jgi:hypothetical protein
MASIVLPSDFDISKLKYGSVRTLDNGGKMVYVSYNGKPLVLQTPKMSAPFGLSKLQFDPTADPKYSIEVSFKGRETKPSIQAFFDLLSSLDKKNLQEGYDNSQNFFKKRFNSVDVVEALYTPSLRFAKDKATGEVTDKYPPTFRLNLPYKDGQIKTDVYGNDRQKVNVLDMNLKGSQVVAIIQCTGLWIAGGKFGCSWRVLQMKVEPQENLSGYAFRDTDDNVEGAHEDVDASEYTQVSVPARQEPAPAPTPAAVAAIASSDDENDDDDENEDDEGVVQKIVVAPPKPVLKRKPVAAPKK